MLGPFWSVLNVLLWECYERFWIWKGFWNSLWKKNCYPCVFWKGHIQGTSLPYWSLPEKCPNTEIFLVRIFLYSDWIRRFTELSPYSVRIQENTDQKKLPIWILFTQWMMQLFRLSSKYLSSICCQKQQMVLMKRLLRRLLIKILQMQNFKQLMLLTYPWPHLFIIIIWRFGAFLKCISWRHQWPQTLPILETFTPLWHLVKIWGQVDVRCYLRFRLHLWCDKKFVIGNWDEVVILAVMAQYIFLIFFFFFVHCFFCSFFKQKKFFFFFFLFLFLFIYLFFRW